MGGGSQPSQTTYQTSTSSPWSGVQVNLMEAADYASQLQKQPYSQFPYVWNPEIRNYNTGQYSPYGMGLSTGMNFSTDPGQQQTPISYTTSGGSGFGLNAGPMTTVPDATQGAVTQSVGTSGGGNQGYYQNFLTGQTSPYGGYLPYTSQVAGFNPYQTSALSQVANIASQGDPLAASATGMLGNTLQGNYLYPESNPYLRSTFQAAADPVMQNYLNATYPSLRSAAAKAGQFGSSSDALVQGQAEYGLGQSLQNLATGIYGGAYQAERANQLKAALEAPSVSAEAFTYPQALLSAGTTIQQQQQQQLNDMVNQWAQQVNYPWSTLGNYVSVLGGLPISGGQTAGTSTGINPYYVSGGQQLLGTASSLGGMGLGAAGLLMALGII